VLLELIALLVLYVSMEMRRNKRIS
jgi:hypothetical protein